MNEGMYPIYVTIIKKIPLFCWKLKFLTIFDAMKFGALYIWSWRSKQN
jgi:hypothetical protein